MVTASAAVTSPSSSIEVAGDTRRPWLPIIDPLRHWLAKVPSSARLAVLSVVTVVVGWRKVHKRQLAQRRLASDATADWMRFSKNPGARSLALMLGVLRLVPLLVRSKLARDKRAASGLRSQAGHKMAAELIRLGPTYVKVGQILSCREGLMPEEIITALARLQDRVPAFDGEEAANLTVAALGKPLDTVFADFDTTPLAAASLGQVHRATLTEAYGSREVAVKVQRPGLREMYDLDLGLLEKIIGTLDRFNITVGGASQSWGDVFREAKVILYREIDYRDEAANGERFREYFANDTTVDAPATVPELCTEKLLVMDYVPGIKANNVSALAEAGILPQQVANALARAYLFQLCKHGFFNTDPHPGNLAVDPVDGSLIFYDFGQACELDPGQSAGILAAIEAIIDLDAQACIKAFSAMGIIRAGADLVQVENVVRNNFATGKVRSRASRDTLKPATNTLAPSLSKKEANQATKQVMPDIVMPAEYAFVARALSQMDGVGKALDPEFEFIAAVAPVLPELKGGDVYLAELVEKKWQKTWDGFVKWAFPWMQEPAESAAVS